MKMMKKVLSVYPIVFTLSSIVMYGLIMFSLRHLEQQDIRFGIVFIGLLLISFLLTMSILVFQSTWGSGWLNIILSYFLIIPIPFLIRVMLMNRIFRVFRGIYILLGIYLIGYLVFTLFRHLSNRKEEKELNDLLTIQKKTKED